MIDTTTNFVEHPEVIAERLENAAAAVSAIRSASWRAAIAASRPSRAAGASPRTWCGRNSNRWRRCAARVLAAVLDGVKLRPAACRRGSQKKQPWWEECECSISCNTARAIAAARALRLRCPHEPGGIGGRDLEFLHHQSAPLFATSRGAKMLTEEIEKATNGELKMRLHLSGTLQIAPNNITQAVGENVVQLGDDLFNSGNIPVAGIPRLPMLVQSYDDFTKAAAVLRPYLEKAFAAKGSTVLAAYSYPLQVVWGKKKLEITRRHQGHEAARRRSPSRASSCAASAARRSP